jgi:hypothetical protein
VDLHWARTLAQASRAAAIVAASRLRAICTQRGETMASKSTTSHDEIVTWAERHGGKPACVAGTGGGKDPGMLRLMFPESEFAQDDKLNEMGWDEWLRAFDANDLALIYDESSRFNKIVARSTAEARSRGESGASVHHPRH